MVILNIIKSLFPSPDHVSQVDVACLGAIRHARGGFRKGGHGGHAEHRAEEGRNGIGQVSLWWSH